MFGSRGSPRISFAHPVFWLATGFIMATLCITTFLSIRVGELSFHLHRPLSSLKSTQHSVRSNNSSRVLYAVRTCPKYYNSRLKDVLTTYLAKVHSSRILLVGNTPYTISAPDQTDRLNPSAMRNITVHSTDGSDGYNRTICSDDHSEGVTCIEGRALFYAYQRREHFDWIFMVDDDVYVHRHNVEMTVGSLDPLLPLVYTVGGCGPKVKCAIAAGSGICGGGGYFLSRQSLERAICGVSLFSKGKKQNLCSRSGKISQDDLLSDWITSWMKTGAMVARDDGGWWSDITAGCALHIRGGIRTHRMLGLHPWKMSATQVIHKLATEAPLSFHYIHHGEMPGMQAMHKLVTGTNRRSTANSDKFADNVVNVKK